MTLSDVAGVANLIARGRVSYDALSIPEKITFGYWMEELLQGFDAVEISMTDPADTTRTPPAEMRDAS